MAILNKSPLKILEKMERGRIQGVLNFLGTPIILGQVKLRLQIWRVHLERQSQQKPIKMFGEKGAWAYPGTAQFLWVPFIISGTGKATDFKICRNIHRIDRNKSP